MSSNQTKSKDGERTVVRRIRDKEGNIVVKRFKKRESTFNIDINWARAPSVILGTIFSAYAYAAYLNTQDELSDTLGGLGSTLNDAYFGNFTGVIGIFVVGAVAAGVGAALGWSLITKGFKVKQWPSALRQLMTILVILFLVTSIFSAFINEAGLTRQQDEPNDVGDKYDLSGLTAPFYNELLNGLMDLIGNIPDPKETVGIVTPPDGGPQFDTSDDTYLWRWLVAETWNQQENDFKKGHENYRADFNNFNPQTVTGEVEEFRMSQQFLSVGSSYSGEMLSTHQSLVDTPVALENVVTNSTAELNQGSVDAYLDVNQQPVMEADFSGSNPSGFINYTSFWTEELKEKISQEAIGYGDLDNRVANNNLNLPTERFGDLSSVGSVSDLWAFNSLPQGYLDQNAAPAFFNQHQEYSSLFSGGDTSAYQAILRVSNDIQNEVIDQFLNNPEGINSASSDSDSEPAIDRGYYFWQQVAEDGGFGIKDVIAGFTNMLRALNIPSRPVIGFSLGDINPNKITLSLEYLHVWVEALIPWVDSEGNIQMSWATFNPIPDYHRLAENSELEYGKNSMGGRPDLTLEMENTKNQKIPNDQSVAGTNTVGLGQIGSPTNGTVSLGFEGNPAAEQQVELRLLTETELNNLNPSNPSAARTSGESLLNVTTNSNGKAKFSILAQNDGTASAWEEGENPRNLGTTIDQINLINPNDRNVYGIIAFFGVNANISIVGWDINSTIQMDVNAQTAQINDPNFDGNSTEALISVRHEELDYTVTYRNSEGDPIAGEDKILLLVMEVSRLDQVKQDISDGSYDPAQDTEEKFNSTNAQGKSTVSFAFDDSYTVDKYYAVVGYLNGSADVFKEIVVRLTGTLNITTTLFYDGSDPVVYKDETLDTWSLETTTIGLNSYFQGLPGGTTRPIRGINLSYYLVSSNYYDSSSESTVLSDLGSCSKRHDVRRNCYVLNATQTVGEFAVQSTNKTDVNGFNNATLYFHGGDVPDNTYYLLVLADQFDDFNISIEIGFLDINEPSSFSSSVASNFEQQSSTDLDTLNVNSETTDTTRSIMSWISSTNLDRRRYE